jgi:hypothetical protein
MIVEVREKDFHVDIENDDAYEADEDESIGYTNLKRSLLHSIY